MSQRSFPALVFTRPDCEIRVEVRGNEVRESGQPQWLLGHVDVRDADRRVVVEGPVSLALDDVQDLGRALDRLLRPRIGDIGRSEEWTTRDEDLSVKFGYVDRVFWWDAEVTTGAGPVLAATAIAEEQVTEQSLERLRQDVETVVRSWRLAGEGAMGLSVGDDPAAVLAYLVAGYQALTREDLVLRMGHQIYDEIVTESGAKYGREATIMWDGPEGGTVRVVADVFRYDRAKGWSDSRASTVILFEP